ncbi:MAG: DUF4388 domain-containing protein [Thermoanaerobaculia bacterium]
MSSNSANSLFKGDLSQTPLPEVLVTIHRYKAPGVVECVSASETKHIYIDEGNIIFATSTNIDDSLGIRLLKQGIITREQFDESVTRLKESGAKRQGVILVEMRAIEPKQLFVSVKEQVQDIVWSVFEWTEGTVSFQPGRDRTQEFIKLNFPTRQAVIQGVRRIADARTLVARMGKKATVLAKVADADFANLSLTSEEQAQYELVDGKKALYELIQYGPLSPAENAKILYSLFALKLVQVKEAAGIKVKVKV